VLPENNQNYLLLIGDNISKKFAKRVLAVSVLGYNDFAHFKKSNIPKPETDANWNSNTH
jgi:hypothetical protein